MSLGPVSLGHLACRVCRCFIEMWRCCQAYDSSTWPQHGGNWDRRRAHPPVCYSSNDTGVGISSISHLNSNRSLLLHALPPMYDYALV